MHRWARQIGDVATEVGAVSISAIIGLLVIAHLVNSGPASQVDNVPIVGAAVRGIRAAVGQIVNAAP